MSELQIALIVAGVLLMVGIYCLTKIQERRIQRDEEEAFRTVDRDALLDASSSLDEAVEPVEPRFEEARQEPILSSASPVVLPTEATPDGASVADVDDLFNSPAAEERAEAVDVGAGGVSLTMPEVFDSRFDYICGIVAKTPIDGHRVVEAMARLKADLSKPVQWIGVTTKANDWESIDAALQYRYLCIGLQIVDRRGPVTEADVARFCSFIQEFADWFGAAADLPAAHNVVARAEEIDDFCAEIDLQIGLNVISKGAPFNGTKIRALAEASGCMLGDDGCFHRIDIATGKAIFALYNLGEQPFTTAAIKNIKTTELGLMLDLALVSEPTTVFNQMLLFARQLAQTLDGRLVDVNRQPMADSMIDAVRRQLSTYQDNLSEAGIVAGSPLACRLFH